VITYLPFQPMPLEWWRDLTDRMTDAEFARFKARLIYEQSGPPMRDSRR
jgi:hypothetical protein